MHKKLLLSFAFLAPALCAQTPAPAPPAAAELPAAGTAAATALVDQAIAKMLAHGSGAFTTAESRDVAMVRSFRPDAADDEIDVSGGWQRGVLWGERDGNSFVRANGRMVTKDTGSWKLRATKLADGTAAPFLLDPDLLFTLLKDLPAAARTVAHVEAGEVAGKKVSILSLQLTGEAATDLAESGALPGGGAAGGMMLIGGLAGMPPPELTHTVYVALFVEPESGELLRAGVRVCERNPAMGNMRMQVQRAGAVQEVGGDDEPAKEAAPAGETVWKKGFPVVKPAKDESVTTLRADFKQLGLAAAPALDERAKSLLRLP